MSVFELRCKTQTYAWGKIGNDSVVARLKRSADVDFTVDPECPYAELWMGTHPSGASEIVNGSGVKAQKLSEWMGNHQEALGTGRRGSQLPYLLKVLSVNKALSIQAHPNKSHAEMLFKENPDKYPDDNHKPEMAIALTPFEALCGFRPLQEIKAFIKEIPELREAIGTEEANRLVDCEAVEAKRALKQCFTALMNSHQHESLLPSLEERFRNGKGTLNDETRELFLRLCEQFPNDVGCFGVFFFNVLHLQPGQAIFLAANEPHAYLSGDCVECMACSDNVVRAGLTPKWKDVATLCEMLTYEMKSREDNIFLPTPDTSDPYLTHFLPPVKDFAITKIQVPAGVSGYSPPAVDGTSLILTASGASSYKHADETSQLVPGTVLFLSAGARIVLNVVQELHLFQAYEQ